MEHILDIVQVFIRVEFAAFFIFFILNLIYVKNDARTFLLNTKNIVVGMLKGALERGCLFFSLFLGFPQMLIAFGALKVGTRLGKDKDSKVSNDYYLIGNLISIFLVFLVFFLCRDYYGYIITKKEHGVL